MYYTKNNAYQRPYLSRQGASSEPCGYGKIKRGLIAGVGGIALILAVESGALKFRSEQAETTAVGIGVVAILGCGIGIVAGGLERVMKE
ncbi:MAG: hypothetical protein AABX47_03910 [Nanoarchaeota archaeon]|mgnify:CR=1 FL=1